MLWNVVALPRKTPPAVMKALCRGDATRRWPTGQSAGQLADQGMFADLHVGDAAAAAYVKAEAAKWKPIIAKLGDLSKG